MGNPELSKQQYILLIQRQPDFYPYLLAATNLLEEKEHRTKKENELLELYKKSQKNIEQVKGVDTVAPQAL